MPENVTYNGTIQMQKPEVTDRAGNVLEEDKDYTLTYSDDVVNSGIVTVTVMVLHLLLRTVNWYALIRYFLPI